MSNVLDEITAEGLKKDVPEFAIGDQVKVYVKIKEGDKTRDQAFGGVVIARKGAGANETFTVRHVAYGVGVEKVFPVHSPFISKIVVHEREKKHSQTSPQQIDIYFRYIGTFALPGEINQAEEKTHDERRTA